MHTHIVDRPGYWSHTVLPAWLIQFPIVPKTVLADAKAPIQICETFVQQYRIAAPIFQTCTCGAQRYLLWVPYLGN